MALSFLFQRTIRNSKMFLKLKAVDNLCAPESYDFSDVSARYVRITVNGNTQNTFASIAEIKVNINANGGSNPPPPPPPLGPKSR